MPFGSTPNVTAGSAGVSLLGHCAAWTGTTHAIKHPAIKDVRIAARYILKFDKASPSVDRQHSCPCAISRTKGIREASARGSPTFIGPFSNFVCGADHRQER